MNRLLVGVLLLSIMITSCNQQAPVSRKDALGSARGFIESTLKGNFDVAQQYLLQDTSNMQFFEGYKQFYATRNDSVKEGYKNADIIIDSTQNLSDSVRVITYSNTFEKKPTKLKITRKGSDWLVDFKYTFQNDQ